MRKKAGELISCFFCVWVYLPLDILTLMG
ncbi:MAG: hypothetical protein K2O71_03865 [Lachnospiraceae bacterium]|nr:hypothetical protein [Lachnospiraceae bacterium]